MTTGSPAELAWDPPPGSQPGTLERRVPRAERGFAWFALFLATGGCIPILEWILKIRSDDARGGDPFAQAVWAAVYLLAGLLLFVRLPRVIRVLPALGTLWIIVLMAPASSLWSAAPPVTLRRAVALLGTTLVGLYLGTRFSWRELTLLLFSVCAVAVPLSFLVKGLELYQAPGTWQGIFTSKNQLGQVMVFSAIVSLLFALSQSAWRRNLGIAILILSGALLVLSGSKTAIVVLLGAIMLLLPLRVFGLRYRVSELAVIAILVGAGALGVWLGGNSEAVLDLLGRNASLTGRVPLWEMLWGMIQRNPWLGYGYGGFWLYWDGPSAEIWKVCILRYGWLPPNGHNGFLDLWLDLGAIGVLAFSWSLLGSFRRAIRLAQQSTAFTDLFPIMFLYAMVLSNLTESALVTHNSFLWLLFVAITLQLRLIGSDTARWAQPEARAPDVGG